jgi:hypothetical protein
MKKYILLFLLIPFFTHSSEVVPGYFDTEESSFLEIPSICGKEWNSRTEYYAALIGMGITMTTGSAFGIYQAIHGNAWIALCSIYGTGVITASTIYAPKTLTKFLNYCKKKRN